ncbi:hypothetical protein CYMTET_33998, partial [Cymbomonas tetramitiformis]
SDNDDLEEPATRLRRRRGHSTPVEAQLTQQTALLNTMMQQMKDLDARVDASQEATAKVAAKNVGFT